MSPGRILGALAVTAILGLAGAPPAAAASAPPPARDPAAASAASQTLSQCLSASSRALVLLLLDESGSLRERTDPDGARIDGVKAILGGFEQLTRATGAASVPAIEVLLVGFSGKVDPDPADEPAWQELTRTSLRALLGQADAFTGRDNRQDTDYATALAAARELLARRAAEIVKSGHEAPCKALVWFTDGRYQIGAREPVNHFGLPMTLAYGDTTVQLGTEEQGELAVQEGTRYLCRPGGLMDTLVADDVVKFTIALSGDLRPEDQSFLEGITNGGPDGSSCGTTLSPATGEYVSDDDAACLYFLFGDLLQGGGCPNGAPETFTTLPGLARFVVHASAGDDTTTYRLRAPNGESLPIEHGDDREYDIAGATIRATWFSDRAVDIEGTFDAAEDAWVGEWSFVAVQPGAGASASTRKARIDLFADLEPVLDGHPVALRDSRTPLRVTLERTDASRAPAGRLLDAARVSATFTNPKTLETIDLPAFTGPDRANRFATAIDVPPAFAAARGYVNLTVGFETGTGIEIVPVQAVLPLPVELPPGAGYPKLSALELKLPTVSGSEPTSGVLTATGTSDEPGCVAVSEPAARDRVRAPSDAGRVDVQVHGGGDGRCVHLARGQRHEIELVFTPRHPSSDTVRATVPVLLRSAITGDEVVADVAVSFQTLPAEDELLRLALIAVLMSIGILAPLLTLHLWNLYGGRFTPPQLLRTSVQDVVVYPDRKVQRAGGGEVVGSYDSMAVLKPRGAQERLRSLQLDPGVSDVTLRAVASGSLRDGVIDPFRGPYAVATAAHGRLVVGSGEQNLRSWRNGAAREVALSLHDTWIFVPYAIGHDGDPLSLAPGRAPTQVAGRLILLVASGRGHDAGDRLAARAASKLAAYDWAAFDRAGDPDASRRWWRRIAWRPRRIADRRESAPHPTAASPDPSTAADGGCTY